MSSPPTSKPTGTVTFLFTDIEGSTRLWEQNPKAMSDALALQGWASLQEGDTRRAWMLLVESLEGYLEAESRVGGIDSLVDVGAVAGAQGEPLRAALGRGRCLAKGHRIYHVSEGS